MWFKTLKLSSCPVTFLYTMTKRHQRFQHSTRTQFNSDREPQTTCKSAHTHTWCVLTACLRACLLTMKVELCSVNPTADWNEISIHSTRGDPPWRVCFPEVTSNSSLETWRGLGFEITPHHSGWTHSWTELNWIDEKPGPPAPGDLRGRGRMGTGGHRETDGGQLLR